MPTISCKKDNLFVFLLVVMAFVKSWSYSRDGNMRKASEDKTWLQIIDEAYVRLTSCKGA